MRGSRAAHQAFAPCRFEMPPRQNTYAETEVQR
jgi:hypothetical protein